MVSRLRIRASNHSNMSPPVNRIVGLADQCTHASKPCEPVLSIVHVVEAKYNSHLIKYLLNSLFTRCNLLLALRTSIDIVDPDPTQPELSAPVIVTPPKNVTAEIGDNVTLTCAAKGNPKPKIRYHFFFSPVHFLAACTAVIACNIRELNTRS